MNAQMIASHDLNRGVDAGRGGSETFAQRLARVMFGWVAEQRRYRDTMSELSQLSDRELNDIGLERGQIEAVARGTLCRA
jgi:uncharacterized protein YjiS (DUF1127 family)